ncbi:hypothetical protein APSETT444_001591 [Aspergillus pseudonomiae]
MTGARRFHGCCGIESKLDEGLGIPSGALNDKPDNPVLERAVSLRDHDESFRKLEIGDVGSLTRLLDFLRTFKVDRNERPSSCYHWVRDAIEDLMKKNASYVNLRGKWAETQELLANSPDMNQNARYDDGMVLDIQHEDTARQNDTSQHNRSVDVSDDEIGLHVVTQNAAATDKISLEGLSPDFIQKFDLHNHRMAQNDGGYDTMNLGFNDQNPVRGRAMNQNVPPLNSMRSTTTRQYTTNQETMETNRGKHKDKKQDRSHINLEF